MPSRPPEPAAPGGSGGVGAMTALHDDLCPVSSSPWPTPEERAMAPPVTTHAVMDGQVRPLRPTHEVAAPAGSGALAVIHRDPSPVSSSPSLPPDALMYRPVTTQTAA